MISQFVVEDAQCDFPQSSFEALDEPLHGLHVLGLAPLEDVAHHLHVREIHISHHDSGQNPTW